MYATIDIGGTNARCAIIDSLSSPQITGRATFKNNHDFEDYFTKIINFLKNKNKFDGIGISIAGDLNPDKTIVVDSATNAPEILNQPIVDRLKEEFKCNVFMENDGTASAIGEAIYGSPEIEEFIYLIWGTGIGGAFVTRKDGKIVVTQIDWFKHFEDWEYVCGGSGIRKTMGKSADKLTNEDWSKVMGFFRVHLLKLLETFKTKNIVFGGGVALNQFHRLEELKNQLANELPNLYLTKLGDDTGLFGGLALIKNDE